MSSGFEQAIILKGGTSGIFGNWTQGVNWGCAATDYLLIQSLSNLKFNRVVCVNFERNPSVFRELIGTNEHPEGKIKFLHHFKISLRMEEFVTAIVQQIRNLNDSDGIAIIVYSLSEVILSEGLKKGLDFIEQLSLITKTLDKSSIIFQINSSLHPPAVIARLQQKLDTIAIVLPNSGLLAASVAAEVQTIRRSPASGRVSEHLEMFALSPGLPVLQPITPAALNHHITAVTAAAVPSVQRSSLEADEVGGAEQKPLPVHNARLICFDSTDPEFDEDSDPDADLDL